jgi:thiosulfate dehydrogenase
MTGKLTPMRLAASIIAVCAAAGAVAGFWGQGGTGHAGFAQAAEPAEKAAFAPPRDSDIPNGTSPAAASFVGNSLRCASCHLDGGRMPNSAPLWGAYGLYPQFRVKNGHVNNFQERLQGCFMYSMNGKAPPFGHPVLVALEAYSYFLAKGAPAGVRLPGQGYPRLAAPKQGMDYARGKVVYEAQCALCHGADGQGQNANGAVVFPPLWGPKSYNWGAGMSDVHNAAAFIKVAMPLSQGGKLSDQEAWDVASYIDSQSRPQDPRFKGTVEKTRAAFHDVADSMYGLTVNGKRLGAETAARH